MLVVPQLTSDDLSALPGVHTVLQYSNRHGQPFWSLTEPVEEVLTLMKDADWVHFACHGVQDRESPTKCGFCLADQRCQKLSDIIASSRPRGGRASLSACQTAMGDYNVSDDATHIAAGMLFAGYEGVTATMWSMRDRAAPLVARDVYERLFRSPDWRNADCRQDVTALHNANAVRHLRERGASFVEWLPFIHVGL